MEQAQRMDIQETVHRMYWDHDINCARTMLTCLSTLFGIPIEPQTMRAAIGLHGAGGFGAQCGLVEGALMFLGIHYGERGATDGEIAKICREFAYTFTQEFSSLTCKGLRPGGFTDQDPPHACERLTNEAIIFAGEFITKAMED